MSGFGDILGGIGSLFSAGELSQAKKMEQWINEIQVRQQERQVYMTLGAGRAAIGASGLQNSGSAAAVMRASAMQGNIQRSMLILKGAAEYASMSAQQESAMWGGIGGIVGGFMELSNDAAKAAMGG
jgi:hypothetical protein